MPDALQIKVLFFKYENDKVVAVPYKVEEHLSQANKFLYWSETVSPMGTPLLAVASFSYHANVYEAVKDFYDNWAENPTGAGDFAEGKVWDWESSGFKVETPEDLRPLILQALGTEEFPRRFR